VTFNRDASGAQVSVIDVRGLVKRFGEVTAVDGITFTVRSGELFGFLGPNGAGKTTTINLLTGLARPDAGEVQVDGIDCSRQPKAAQDRIGVVPDESNLYPEITGFENLCFCGALYGLRKREREARASELLATFGLSGAAGRKFDGYSKGMKRKLTIAAGLVHRPPILFLDEPTTGIDVASARQIRELIAGLRDVGTTVFLTTHYLEEAERLCDRIAFLVEGRIVRVDTVENLLQPIQERHRMSFWVLNAGSAVCEEISAAFPDTKARWAGGGEIRVDSAEPVRVGPLVRFLEDRGVEVCEARRLMPSLEEVFMQVTGLGGETLRGEKAGGSGP
jgi:ABC-2 type transport system ATP-binding protein